MLSNAYFLAKFRFDTAENEPTQNLQNFRKMHFPKMHFSKMHFSKMLRVSCDFSQQEVRPEAGRPARAARQDGAFAARFSHDCGRHVRGSGTRGLLLPAPVKHGALEARHGHRPPRRLFASAASRGQRERSVKIKLKIKNNLF